MRVSGGKREVRDAQDLHHAHSSPSSSAVCLTSHVSPSLHHPSLSLPLSSSQLPPASSNTLLSSSHPLPASSSLLQRSSNIIPVSTSLPSSWSSAPPDSSSVLESSRDTSDQFKACGAIFADDLIEESGSHPSHAEVSGTSFSADDVRRARICNQCASSHCTSPDLHGPQCASKGSETESVHDQDSLFPSSFKVLSHNSCHDVAKSSERRSSSLWSGYGQQTCNAWTEPGSGKSVTNQIGGGRKFVTDQRSPSHQWSVAERQQAGVMSVVSMRRCRQWLGVGLPLAAFLYVLLYCNSAVWSSFSLQHQPLPNTLSGSGFRKLLEEQEKARLSVSVSNAGLTQRLPSCIIIGVRKCGTRALLEFLDLHPDIVTARDEMHFFNDDERYRLGLEWYRHLMPLSLPHQITMEKTPGYFISPIAPSRVHRMNSTVKLIVLLRHPTTRTISDYTQIFYNKLSKNETLEPFEDIVIDRDTGEVNTRYKAVQISMYHHHFRHWTQVFPNHQIHVVDGDRLITDPVSEIQLIEKFLGIEHRIDYSLLYYNSTRGFYCMHMNATYERCLGASKGRKHPDIQLSVVRKLNKFFQPHNKELFNLIQRKFPWS